MHNMRRKLALLLAGVMVVGSLSTSVTDLRIKAAAAQQTDVNLLPNGTFDSNLDSWSSYTTDGGEAALEQKDGKLVVNISSIGTLNYSVQASCGQGFQLYKNGKYRLSFDASSSVARDISYRIQLNGGDYRGYLDGQVSIDSTTKTVSVDFTMKEDNDMAPGLCFNMGLIDGNELPAHTVTFDNVKLELLDGSGIVYEDKTEEEQKININQVGYKPDDTKVAVFRGVTAGSKFKVVSTADDSVVYEGTISNGSYNSAADEIDYTGDFSSVKTEGTYRIEVEGIGTSYNFKIGDDIYNSVFKDAMRFFYLQRCGEELPESYASVWAHNACHLTKARIYGTNDYIDVSGGWHDAGDYGRYVVATSKAAADLLLAYDADKAAFGDNFNIPESGNNQSDLLDEIKGQMEWLQKMQNKESGGVYHKVTCANFPGRIAADEETAELIVSPVSTQATGDFAAVMAMGYEAFKDVDPEFANTCLAAGEKAYDYLDAAPSSVFSNPTGIVTGEYADTSDSDERYWAAAALYKATGESKYNDKFKSYVNEEVQSGYSWGWVGSYGNTLYLQADNQDSTTSDKIKSAVLEQADTLLKLSKSDGYGISNGGYFGWGSNMDVLNNANVLMDAYRISNNNEYYQSAKEHLNYILGKNPLGTSYVTNTGTVSPQNPHHRPSMVAGKAIPGAVVGGPNMNLEDNYAKAYLEGVAPAKCYLDSAESYSTNEVDIYWNSPLVRAMAELGVVEDNLGEEKPEPSVTPTSEAPTSEAPTSEAPTSEAPTSVTPSSAAPTEVPSPTVSGGEISDVGVGTSVVTNAGSNSVGQTYQITANKSQPVDLSKLVLRYYFTKDDTEPMSFWCDNAAAQLNAAPWYTSFTSTTTGTIKQDGNGYYIEITFGQAFTINPGEGTVNVQTRFANANWSNINNFKEGNLVVLYDGKTVK